MAEMGVGAGAAGVVGMSIHDELKKLGYKFDHEHGCSEDRTEVWVNRSTGMGIAIEWFRLPEVRA